MQMTLQLYLKSVIKLHQHHKSKKIFRESASNLIIKDPNRNMLQLGFSKSIECVNEIKFLRYISFDTELFVE